MNSGMLPIVGLLLLFAGCISSTTEGDGYILDVYYFYHPKCPNCIATAPYISYLEEKYNLDIRQIDVSKVSNRELVEVWNITAVPTLIIITSRGDSSEEYRYVGRIDVPKAEPLIARLMGMPAPEKPYNINISELDPMQCLACHAQRQLPPPSTYSCTACCHTPSNGGRL